MTAEPVWLLGCALLALVGCTDFPVIEANRCGNAVKEAGEDCDTFPKTSCRPPGVVGECRFDCSRRSDDSRAECPSDWGCDSGGICREASGDFAPEPAVEVGAVSSLLAGDFDGDGRVDILSREPPDAVLQSELRLHYFTEDASLAETRHFPKAVATPAFRDINGDERADLVFSDFRVGVLLGRANRNWVPETFSSYHIADARIRMVGLHDGLVDRVSGFAVLTTIEGRPGLYVADAATRRLGWRADLDGSVDDLMGEAVAGDIVEGAGSPCMELVLALRGASSFSVFELCRARQRADPATPEYPAEMPVWLPEAREQVVLLPSKAKVDGAPIVADIDGDGHLDVLIGAAGRPHLARGDGLALEPSALPYALPFPGTTHVNPEISMPIAVGDFTGDGFADFVFERALLASRPVRSSEGVTYAVSQGNNAAPWTVARILDLNGNGVADVATASNQGVGVNFFNGTGGPFLVETVLPTDAPVRDLAAGDFDGDLTSDLAFIEVSSESGGKDSLKLSFGGLATPPSPPVEVARVQSAEALTSYREAGFGSLLVASSDSHEGQSRGALTLLDGSADRLPFAPYVLASFSYDGSIQNAAAMAVTLGSYTEAGARDVFALGSDDLAGQWSFWLVPSIDRGIDTPLRLDGTLDARLNPLGYTNRQDRLSLANGTADVDGDALDESLWLMPADEGKRCGLSIYSANSKRKRLVSRGFLVLDEPCGDPELLPADLDRDDALDILVLTGARDGYDRSLKVLWNDGSGGFSLENSTNITEGSGEAVRGFAVFEAPHTPSRAGGRDDAPPARVAYITDSELYEARVSEGNRSFEPRRLLHQLADFTGVAVADANGDGLADIVVAHSGSLTVLKAALSR